MFQISQRSAEQSEDEERRIDPDFYGALPAEGDRVQSVSSEYCVRNRARGLLRESRAST